MNCAKRKINGKTFFKNKDGYYRNGRTTLHRFKYEKKYGTVLPCFHLHHKDGNKQNNNISNLVMLTPKEHVAIHKTMRRQKLFEGQLVLEW